MTIRRASLALALLACVGIGAFVLNRPADPVPEIGADVDYQCTTCDARMAAKKRLREDLQSDAAEGE